MRLDDLNHTVERLDEALATLAPSRVRQIEWLRYDLNGECREQLDNGRLPRPHQSAWYKVTTDRVAYLRSIAPTRVRDTLTALHSTLRAQSPGVSLRLKFGQMSIAGAFQAHNVGQDYEGFPDDLPGSNLNVVAGRLQSGTYAPDQLTVRMFWHPTFNQWIVANNRGFTAHCIARVRPLRLWPTVFGPVAAEITRLAEVEGANGVPVRLGHRAGEPAPRRLPSGRMFVTPVGNNITQVVEVPGHWT